jgi:hypothetical protein
VVGEGLELIEAQQEVIDQMPTLKIMPTTADKGTPFSSRLCAAWPLVHAGYSRTRRVLTRALLRTRWNSTDPAIAIAIATALR